MKETDHLQDLGVAGSSVLKWISKRWQVGSLTGFGCLTRQVAGTIVNVWVPLPDSFHSLLQF